MKEIYIAIALGIAITMTVITLEIRQQTDVTMYEFAHQDAYEAISWVLENAEVGWMSVDVTDSGVVVYCTGR